MNPSTETPEEKPETFLSHLVELRHRLVRALIAVMVVFLGLVYWSSQIYDLFAYPMLSVLPEGTKMIATGVISPLMVPIKVTALVAFMIALPYVLYQMWAFVAPGLYNHEKKLVLPLVILSWILFLIGIAFCYLIVFGTVFKVIYSWAPTAITVAPDIEQYLSFVLSMFLAFGITFEVPVVVMVLVRSGLVTIEQLKDFRSYFIVGSFVIAAVVTPPDVVSQLLLAIPLCILYEIGIFAARFMTRPAVAAPAESAPADAKPADVKPD